MIRLEVARQPAKLLHVRPRHIRVLQKAIVTSIPLEREKLNTRRLDRYERKLFARLKSDPRFYRDFDDLA